MVEQGIYQLLTSTAPITGLMGTRLYPLLLPESPTLPAVTYQVIASVPQYTLDGALGLVKTRIEFNAWGTGYLSCKQVSTATRNVLEPFKGKLTDGALVSDITVVNSTDYFDSDARIYRVQTDYLIWHSV